MSNIRWKRAFYAAVFSFALIFLDIRTGAAFEGSAMGYAELQRAEKPNGTTGVSLQAYPHIVQLSDPMVPHEGHGLISRRKRNILFPSGVKLCSQETSLQVAANHLNYFHLRVCQETVWEAFKIFWDRLPEQDEYQRWMSQCQEGEVKVHDIGVYFSQSQEHQTLVDARMAMQGLKSIGSEPLTSTEQPMCGTPSPEDPEEAEALEEATAEAASDAGEEAEEEAGTAAEEEADTAAEEEEDTAAEEEEGAAVVPEVEVVPVVPEASSVDNDIAMEPPTPPVLEQVVELSILLTGERYSEQLRDPTSLQYQTLDRQFTEKIDDALEGLPGFKNVAVLDFRPQKDSQRLDGVVVDYAVTMLVGGGGVSAEQLDYLTLQSNRVENSYREVQERPTVVYTVSEVRNYVTEALHNEALESDQHTYQSSAPEIRETVHSINEATGGNTLPDETKAEVLEEEASDVTMDEPLPGTPEGEVGAAEGANDVIVLEESATEAPAPALTTAAPQSDSIEEESLMLEETAQGPVAEELPAEPTSPVQPEEDAAPPEPSPEIIEASGSAPEELEDLLLTITTEDDEPDAEEDEAAEGDIIPEQDSVEEDVVEEPAVEVEPVPREEADEVVVDVAEVPAELETETETAAEEDTDEVVEQLEAVAPADPQPSEHGEEEDVVEEALEKEDDAGKEDVALDSPVVEEQAPEAPGISTEDLTEDEILLVDGIVPAPVATDLPAPPKPTVLSAERESPFTRVSDIVPGPDGLPVMEVSIAVEVQTSEVDLADVTGGDLGYDVIHYGLGPTNHTEEGSSGFPSGVVHSTDQASIALPANPGRALMVFFSLRVTNMMFSDDLFNKSSAEYKALEQRFIELLVPYLQSNLSNFQNLEILNFRNGSIVVNSRMKFGKPVPRSVNTAVYLILEDFCNTAYQTMNLAIDKYSLDVESGDQADPCKFQACNEYAKCKPNRWSGEAECVCNPGYFSVEGLPCQSICELKTDFCQNDGKCDIIPGQGAICRCRVGENWWYRGEHCEEYVSEPLVVGIAIASVAGFLLVASGVIFFLARTLRDQYEKDEAEDPIRRAESLPSLERATKYNPMYESEATTGYSHYYRRYPEAPVYSSASAEASTDFSSEEIRHIYENSELTKEEIQDRIRIVELYAKDRQFADFVRQHQAVLDTRNESSSAAQT